MLRFSGRRLLVTGAVVVVGLLVAGGIAYATIPDSGGVIHGCYQKEDGQLRVIDVQAGGACRASEQSLDWSAGGSPAPTIYTVAGSTINVPPQSEWEETVNCNGNDVPTGGGFFLSSGALRLVFSVADPHGWEVDVQNPDEHSGFAFHTTVQCMKVS